MKAEDGRDKYSNERAGSRIHMYSSGRSHFSSPHSSPHNLVQSPASTAAEAAHTPGTPSILSKPTLVIPRASSTTELVPQCVPAVC